MTEINILKPFTLPDYYFLPRDYEIVQPIYDIAFFLKIETISRGSKEPGYRAFSLDKAAHNMDSYSASISKWMEGNLNEDKLDYVPTPRIKSQLVKIKETGTIPELHETMSPQAEGCLRLRSIRGLGPGQIARFFGEESGPSSDALASSAKKCGMSIDDILKIFQGNFPRKWQSAHIVPPLLRLLNSFENLTGKEFDWHLIGILDAVSVVEDDFKVYVEYDEPALSSFVKTIGKDPFFHLKGLRGSNLIVQHQMGWYFEIGSKSLENNGRSLKTLAWDLDPLIQEMPSYIKSDLHTHTFWSDGAATPDAITHAATQAGLDYIAITDHSRSSKLQRGLTPSVWLRQAMSIYTLRNQHKVLNGMEVDILHNGDLDMPVGILSGMDLIVGSIHSGFGENREQNTSRILRAIETGHVDIIGHPTTALMGRPGSPSYVRPPIAVDWHEVFACCSKWQVGLEVNCFPSRLDISAELLNQAIEAGCWISLGSDSHSRSHQDLIKFGIPIIDGRKDVKLLNSLNFKEIKLWLKEARELRKLKTKIARPLIQRNMFDETETPVKDSPVLLARYDGRPTIPQGSIIVGIDLTAGKNRKTAVAKLSGNFVETTSLRTDADILEYIREVQPAIVSIDSPLGLPGGGNRIDPGAGIMRIAERDLASVGIPAYPALIGSMKELTLRGIRLRKAIESFDNPPTVIESYPGAAQDLFAIPRKQRGLNLLLSGLTEMGLSGSGLHTKSHDELDAITSAIVGRFFEVGQYEAMGIPSEAQLIVPKTPCLIFDKAPVICLAGAPGSGKSVVGRYLALYYGFNWIKTGELLQYLTTIKLHNEHCNKILVKQSSHHKKKCIGLCGENMINDSIYYSFINKLVSMVTATHGAVVIDSILLNEDISLIEEMNREIFIWYVYRPSTQNKLANLSQIDAIYERIFPNQAAIDLYRKNNYAVIDIINNETLQKLHWSVDNALFSMTVLNNNAY